MMKNFINILLCVEVIFFFSKMEEKKKREARKSRGWKEKNVRKWKVRDDVGGIFFFGFWCVVWSEGKVHNAKKK